MRDDRKFSDELVERAAKALCLYAMGEGVWERDHQDMWREQARAALEVVLSEGEVYEVSMLKDQSMQTPIMVPPGRYLVIPLESKE